MSWGQNYSVLIQVVCLQEKSWNFYEDCCEAFLIKSLNVNAIIFLYVVENLYFAK